MSRSPAWDVRTGGLIRALLYPVIFVDAPDEDDARRVLKQVVDAGALGASPDDYREAIRRVCASDEPLTELADNPRSDGATRSFLRDIHRCLERDDGSEAKAPT